MKTQITVIIISKNEC